MNKEEALKRLEAIEEETKALKEIINKPDEFLYKDLNEGDVFTFTNDYCTRIKTKGGHLTLNATQETATYYKCCNYTNKKVKRLKITKIETEEI